MHQSWFKDCVLCVSCKQKALFGVNEVESELVLSRRVDQNCPTVMWQSDKDTETLLQLIAAQSLGDLFLHSTAFQVKVQGACTGFLSPSQTCCGRIPSPLLCFERPLWSPAHHAKRQTLVSPKMNSKTHFLSEINVVKKEEKKEDCCLQLHKDHKWLPAR